MVAQCEEGYISDCVTASTATPGMGPYTDCEIGVYTLVPCSASWTCFALSVQDEKHHSRGFLEDFAHGDLFLR